MLGFLVIFSFVMVGYAYFGYPLLLVAARKVGVGRAVARAAAVRPMTVIITVRNEERVLEEKLEATLALLYGGASVGTRLSQRDGSMQVIVASDASDDGTDAIARRVADRGIELVRLETRGGKETAQRAAVAAATGELIVFTDAKIMLNEAALDNFASYFADGEVGAVSSIDRVLSDTGESSGEGFYVRYEMWLRSLESDINSLVGLSGSCFAVRRSVCDDLATDIPSDFALLLECRRRGLRGVHAPDVVGSYRAVRSEKEEFGRKVRTVLRGITTLLARVEVLNPARYGLFAWQVFSHKLCRWLVPWFLLIGTFGTLILAPRSPFFMLLAAALVAFTALAAIGWKNDALRQRIWCKVPLFFLVSNAGIFIAWLKYLSGQRAVVWNPSAKGG